MCKIKTYNVTEIHMVLKYVCLSNNTTFWNVGWISVVTQRVTLIKLENNSSGIASFIQLEAK